MMRTLLLPLFATAMFISGPVQGQSTYLFPLTGQGVTPTVQTDGYGVASLTLDGTNLGYRIEFTGLSSNLTGVAFYDGTTLQLSLPANTNVLKGSIGVTPEQAIAVTGGWWSLRVDSAGFPGGELQGAVAATIDPAETRTYEIALTPENVAPASASSGSRAFGTARIVQRNLTNIAYHCEFFGIKAESPTNKVLHVYFKRGAAGKNGSTIINTKHYAPAITGHSRHDTLPSTDPGMLSPVINTNNVSLLNGAQLIAGLWYSDIKTTKYLSGAARGQVVNTGPIVGTNRIDFAISPWQTVPASGRSVAKGSGTVTLINGSNFSCRVEYSDLLGGGPLKAAHFHKGRSGENGGHGLDLPDGSLNSPINFSATIPKTAALQLLSGCWYLNLHTDAYQAGELRSQVSSETFSGAPSFACDMGGDGFADALLLAPHEEAARNGEDHEGGHGKKEQYGLQVLHLTNGVPFGGSARHGVTGHDLRLLDHKEEFVGVNEFTYDDDPDLVISEGKEIKIIHGTNLSAAAAITFETPRRSKVVGTGNVLGNYLGEILFQKGKIIYAIDPTVTAPAPIAIYTNETRRAQLVAVGYFHGNNRADLVFENKNQLIAVNPASPGQTKGLGKLAKGFKVVGAGSFKAGQGVTILSARRNIGNMGIPGELFYAAEKGVKVVGPR